jgi:hypothetical protein
MVLEEKILLYIVAVKAPDHTSQSLFVTDAVKYFGQPPRSVSRTTFAVESPLYNTVSPGGGGPKHFPASITNFESFPNSCISRDCRLTGYFIINM